MRRREYTPAALERAVNRYFQSITRAVRRTEMVPTGERDGKGHMICEEKPVINSLGKEVEVTEYIVPPTVRGLCKALGISRTTWSEYCRRPEFAGTAEEVYERMKDWNESELLTRPGKDVKGIIFNLENNYGYRTRTSVDLSGGAVEAYLQRLAEDGGEAQEF